LVRGLRRDRPVRYRELMHLHQNPNRGRLKSSSRNAALQIRASSPDDLTIRASSEAAPSVLHLICSI
jgi:hypothetical protein